LIYIKLNKRRPRKLLNSPTMPQPLKVTAMRRSVRTRYIPTGSRKITDKRSDAVAYVYGAPPALGYLVYIGKRSRPIAHFSARTQAEVEKGIAREFQSRQWAIGYRANARAQRTAWENDYQVGDIVNTCWGYEQTQREYFQIVAVKGKTVTLREIAVETYATGWGTETVIPLPGDFTGEPFRRRAQEHGIRIDKVRRATRTHYTEAVPGVRAYSSGHTSSYH